MTTAQATGAVLTPALPATDAYVPAATAPATALPAITYQTVAVPATSTAVPGRKMLQTTTTSGAILTPAVPASTLTPAVAAYMTAPVLSSYATTPSTAHPFLSWCAASFLVCICAGCTTRKQACITLAS